MKEQLELLQSFDPAERAHGGEQLVGLGLNRCADALLDHVANEFDTQVLAAIAHAVLQAPADPKESKKSQELRTWAAAEVERSAIEESFMGEAPAPAGYRFELPPEDDAPGIQPDRQPLPARVPAAVVAGEPDAAEYRFDLPPETEPVEWETESAFEVVEYHAQAEPAPAAVQYEAAALLAQDPPEPAAPVAPEPAYAADPAPAYEPAPEPAYTDDPQRSYLDDMPTPVGAPGYESSAATEAPPYIYWRPPADDGAAVEWNGDNAPTAVAQVTDDAHPEELPGAPLAAVEPPPVEELVDPSWPGIEPPTLEPRAADEPAPGEFRFAGPEPLAPAAEVAPEPSPSFEAAPVEQQYEHPAPPAAETYETYGTDESYDEMPPEDGALTNGPVQSAPVVEAQPNPFPEYRFETPDPDAAAPAAPVADETEPAEEAGPPRTLAERLRARKS